ncbi:MAG TPA: nucleotidyltransferase family protein [Syntrophomonadaceae bacterium]|nr:nucleotidyltransferase family protein [Syntrophomonadaceae bacterium]
MISAVILAAGLSRRMGRPKQLLKLGDKTMLEHVVDRVSRAKVSEIIVVLGAHRREIDQVLCPYNVRCVYNPRYASGLGTSVATGAVAVDPEARGILFVAGDQPLITSEFISDLIDVFEKTGALIVRTEMGIPAIFNIRLKGQLIELTGDTGGRQLLEKFREEVVTVPGCPGFMYKDVDTEEDYQKVMDLWEKLQ